MKSFKISFVIVLKVVISLIIFIGCSDKPSDLEVAEAVRTTLTKEVPNHIVEYWSDGYDGKITHVDIIERGEFNENRKYWPIKIRVKGFAKIDIISIPPKVQLQYFNSISDFMLYKNDYGKWIAKTTGTIFK